jgi:hypothetical protein
MANVARQNAISPAVGHLLGRGSDLASGILAARRYVKNAKGQMQAGTELAPDDGAKEWNDQPGVRVIGSQGHRAVVTGGAPLQPE